MEKDMIPIYLAGEQVGQGSAETAGLYTRFACDCGPCGGQILRLVLQCGEEEFYLGIPVPKAGSLRLERMIPTKHLPGSEMERMCLYTEYPLPKMEEKETKVEERREKVEENGAAAGELYDPEKPLPGVENWRSLRVNPDGKGNLLVTQV